jgi:hypothetical protein
MTMTTSESERAERRERQPELADRLGHPAAGSDLRTIGTSEMRPGGDEGQLIGMLNADLSVTWRWS